MRSVRCDVCGTKALMAASTCPKCAHAFSVRDGFGELLPLSHCSTCNSDYPASIGSCKWCGTVPERARVGPYVWKGIGIAAFVGMAWGAWLVHDDPPTTAASSTQLQGLLKPDSSSLPSDSAVTQTFASADLVDSSTVDTTAIDPTVRDIPTSVVAADSFALPMTAGVVLSDSAGSDSIVSVQSAGAVAEPESLVAVEPARRPTPAAARPATPGPRSATPPRVAARTPAPAPSRTTPRTTARTAVRPAARPPAKVAARVATAPKASARSRKAATGRWTNSIARTWVVVRADPNRKSRIIASIGPSTRVQLGETRGAWRRVKAKGLSGWAEHRSFLAVVPARRAGRLAAR
jgi:Bacterial SH3 domain